ncbi:MAG: hypothetical protein V4714_14030 [Bacteroidota bacterium]
MSEAVENGFVQWSTTDLINKQDTVSLIALCQALAVFQLCLNFRKGDYGYKTKGEFYQVFASLLAVRQMKYLKISNVRILQNKIAKARTQGIIPTIQIKNQGNHHASKPTFPDRITHAERS